MRQDCMTSALCRSLLSVRFMRVNIILGYPHSKPALEPAFSLFPEVYAKLYTDLSTLSTNYRLIFTSTGWITRLAPHGRLCTRAPGKDTRPGRDLQRLSETYGLPWSLGAVPGLHPGQGRGVAMVCLAKSAEDKHRTDTGACYTGRTLSAVCREIFPRAPL